MRRARRSGRGARAAPGALTPAFLDRATLAIRIACSGPVHPDTLDALDALVERHPAAADLRFARACLLEDLGRLAAAARDYATILSDDPAHRGALINAGTMAYVAGRTAAALGLYRRAAVAYPDDVVALVDLAHVLADLGAWDESRERYERALALEPEHAGAHDAFARLLDERADPAAAAHRERAFARPVVDLTQSTSATPLRVLVPFAAGGGNLVTTLLFDDRTVETTTVVAESYRATWPLPPHDLVFNAVADADRSDAALAAVEALVAASGRPCINAPAAIRATGREEVMRRLRAIPGVVVPRTASFPRSACSAETLAAAGFDFPLLLRAPGFHAGRHFVRVASAADLAALRDTLPGDELLVIAFLDARDAAGRFRKYRMMTIDGALLPLHLAVARRWKVHYFSGDNAVRRASRDLEADYLGNPRAHLGAAAYAALERVRDELRLDYGGIDFTLDAAGRVVVFEANASFALYYPDDDATAGYRRPHVDAALDAVHAMIRTRALRGRALVQEHGAFDGGKDVAPA